MSDLNMTVDFTDLQQLQKVIDQLGPAFGKTVARLQRENKQLENTFSASAAVLTRAMDETVGAKAQAQYKAFEAVQRRRNQLAQEYEKIAQRQAAADQKVTQEIIRQRDAAEELARTKAKNFQAQIGGNLGLGAQGISAAGSADAFGAEIERLRLKYDQIYASSQLYERSLNELKLAHNVGVLSVNQHKAAVDALNIEYQQFQSGAANSMNRFVAAQSQSLKGVNRMGMVTQQVGYQVGDFLVQVQGGTNAFVAFGQQATQLAGLLSTFPGFALLGAGLGIAIPLVTALGAAWMRTRVSQDDAAESSKRTKEVMDSLASSTESLTNKIYMLQQGYADAESAAAAMEMLRLRRELLEVEAQIADRQGKAARTGADAAAEKERQAALKQEIADLKEANRLYEEKLRIFNFLESAKNYGEELVALRQRQALEVATVKHGQDSFQVKKLVAQAERETYEASLKRQGIDKLLIAGLMAQYDLGVKNATAAEFWKTRTEEVKSVLDTINGLVLKVTLQIKTNADGMAAAFLSSSLNYGKILNSGDSGPDAARREVMGLNSPGNLQGTLASGAGGVFKGESSGGGGGGGNARLESLISELQTEQETLAIWYEESQTALQSASDAELTILGGKHEAMLRLTEEYIKRKGEIEEMGNKWSLESALGGAAEIFGAMGAFNKKALKAQAVFAAGAALISTYQGAAKELAKGTLGFATAAAVIAKGIGFVAAIKSAGNGDTSGRGRGGSSVATSTVAPAAAAPTPQSVYIDSINPSDLYSGQTLINLFDALYDENDKRGKVFVVGR